MKKLTTTDWIIIASAVWLGLATAVAFGVALASQVKGFFGP